MSSLLGAAASDKEGAEETEGAPSSSPADVSVATVDSFQVGQNRLA